MRLIDTVRLRLRSLLRRSRVEDELRDEFQFHLEHLVDEQLARGLPPEEARLAALRAMDGLELQKERCRDARRLGWLEDLLQDLRYASRSFRRTPGFAAVVVLSLALGIGANTAIFGALDAIMLRTLPVTDPGALVLLTWSTDDFPQALADTIEGGTGRVFPHAAYEQIRDRNDVFAATFAFAANGSTVNFASGAAADSATVEGVSGNYFDALGVRAAHGRVLQPQDDRDAAAAVAVVSHRFWTRALGGDRAAVGRAVAVNGAPVTIVGVAPAGFFGLAAGAEPDVWVTLHEFSAQQIRLGYAKADGGYVKDARTWWLQIAGRLKTGVSEQTALAQSGVLFDRYVAAVAGSPLPPAAVPRLGLLPLGQGIDDVRRSLSRPLTILMAMVALVLLIACANVAGLMLARATARERETAIRSSLGAGGMRLVRQFLTESVLLAALGGAAGLVVAAWMNRALTALLESGDVPFRVPMTLDARVLAFTAAVSIATGLAFGLAPALRARRIDPRAGTRLRSRKLLVVAQVALCLVLLVAAGALIRTLQTLRSVDVGFDRDRLVVFTVRPGLNGYKDARLVGYYDDLRRRLSALPQVRAVTFARRAIIGGGLGRTGAVIPGVTREKEKADMLRHEVGPGYFGALGIPLIKGRAFAGDEPRGVRGVVVVNEQLVKRYFRDEDPIGRALHFGSAAKPAVFEIVGVARDTKYADVRGDAEPVFYVPYRQLLAITNSATYTVRVDGGASAVMPLIAREALALDPNVPVVGLKTQDEAIGRTLVLERLLASLTGAFGMLALALACVGLYGTMAYAVARRTTEIGIRMALGAADGTILRMILRETSVIVLVGLVCGLPLALAATRLLRSRTSSASARTIRRPLPEPWRHCAPSRSPPATCRRAARRASIRSTRCDRSRPGLTPSGRTPGRAGRRSRAARCPRSHSDTATPCRFLRAPRRAPSATPHRSRRRRARPSPRRPMRAASPWR